MNQLYLDDFIEGEVEKKQNMVVGKVEEVGEEKMDTYSTVSDVRDPEKSSRCPCCGGILYRLHSGAMYLYVRGGRFRVLADMDHVYDKCKYGFIDNLKYFYHMFMFFKERCLDVIGVGKAYDDDLYVVSTGSSSGRFKNVEYDGRKISFMRFKNVEDFEHFERYLQMVDLEVVDEVLREVGRRC
ncbi:MAG: hypothetical protein ABDH32_07720 [Candidatus Caldarchaeales archaeon]